jgi:hypothetical protein
MTYPHWLLFFLLALVAPAIAAEAIYPPGSRIGLVPPPGLAASRAFVGFEDLDKKVAILLTALPAAAYAEIERSNSADILQAQGASLEAREDLTLPVGKALLLIGRRQIEKTSVRIWLLAASLSDLTALVTMQVPDAAKITYPDSAIRAALASLAVRPEIPVEEQLGLLPFRLAELAGFKVGGIFPGRAIILTDIAKDGPSGTFQPQMLVGVTTGQPVEPRDRDRFALEVFGSIPNLNDIRIISSEALRIGGQQAHEIMGNAKEGTNGTDVSVVQWLRFGGSGYMQLVGVAPKAAWPQAYARFRSVRDGIEPH